MRKISLWALCFVFVVLMSGSALADTYTVSVGYADGLRGPGFFPNPWFGDAGVTFIGSGAPYDAGAVMITNTSGSTITVNDVLVNINGTLFDLWGSNNIGAGNSLILTQTTQYNFDTSDYSGSGCGVNSGQIPTVRVTVNGAITTFSDTGQVLNTSGYDFACNGANESFAWRPINGAGGPAGVPEPSTLILMGSGGLGFLGYFKKRFAK